MELYTLDGLLRRTELVEGFESFIWTERYSDLGELDIVTPSTQQFRNLLASGTFLGLSESERVMRVATIEDAEDESGVKKLSVHCKEISDILNDRVAMTGLLGTVDGTWTASGKASDVIRTLFDFVCRTGSSSIGDQLPFMTAGSLYPVGNLPEDEDSYTIERETGPLYVAIKEIADVWDLGFRMYKGLDDATLYFDVYKGNDRTTNQTTLNPVIFSEDLDSLQQVSELTSVAKSKNVAHVTNDYRTVIAYADGASDTTAGFAKRTLFVNASDIKYPIREGLISDDQQKAINKAGGLKEALETHRDALQRLISRERLAYGQAGILTSFTAAMVTATLLTSGDKTFIDAAISASTALEAAETLWMTAALTQRGQEELAKNRSISAFDGEITPLSPYKYRRDYFMGDLVEMRNSTGLTNQMLVTEQIFAADVSGERAYPTLTIKLFITPGSWLAWENTQVWQDAPGVWATS